MKIYIAKVLFYCLDGVYKGVSSLLLPASSFLRDITTYKKQTPIGILTKLALFHCFVVSFAKILNHVILIVKISFLSGNICLNFTRQASCTAKGTTTVWILTLRSVFHN